jgi:hypothetical protein
MNATDLPSLIKKSDWINFNNKFCDMHATDLPSLIKNSDWINFNNKFCDMLATESTIRLVTYVYIYMK